MAVFGLCLSVPARNWGSRRFANAPSMRAAAVRPHRDGQTLADEFDRGLLTPHELLYWSAANGGVGHAGAFDFLPKQVVEQGVIDAVRP